MTNYGRWFILAVASAMLLQGCALTYAVSPSTGENFNTIVSDKDYQTQLVVPNSTAIYRLVEIDSLEYSLAFPGGGLITSSGNVQAFNVNSLAVVEFDRSDDTPVVSTGLSLQSVSTLGYWNGQIVLQSNPGPGIITAWNTAIYDVVDTGIDSTGQVGWGRWINPNTVERGSTNTQIACCSNNESLQFVYGNPTPNTAIPTTGVATFNLIGDTSPTISDGSVAPGTLTSGQVAVLWGGATANTRLGVNLQGTIGGTSFQIKSPGYPTVTLSSPISYNPTTQSFSGTFLAAVGNPNLNQVSGFFAGPNASLIGLTYSTPATVGGTLSSTVSIQGAAAFKR